MFEYILLIIGFIALIKGADMFVESASGIAKKIKIPNIIIGMTIVAMGTSAPEFSVSLQSSIAGMSDISIANVVGSNIFNLLVVLGVSALFSKLKITKYKDVLITLAISVLLTSFALNGYLSAIEGLILLGGFIIYIISMIKNKKETDENVETFNKNILLTIVLGVIGLGAIVYGGNLVVDSASKIATTLGMSQNLIGLTIVAIGTSLPELVTSVVAIKKGENDIAVGNVLGSNIFNMLLIIGASSVINPMNVSLYTFIDIIFITVTLIIFILLTYKKQEVNKYNGLIFIIIYISYIIYTIIR
jgi:cation:H+ antiporter